MRCSLKRTSIRSNPFDTLTNITHSLSSHMVRGWVGDEGRQGGGVMGVRADLVERGPHAEED